MRYATASALSMTALTRGVAAPSLVGEGVAAAGRSHLGAARLDAAWAAAVALPAVAPAADQEDQAASNAVPLPGAVVILSGNRGLQPRGTGRAALSRGDFDRIPASLLLGDRGARFVDLCTPRLPFTRGRDLLFHSLARRYRGRAVSGPSLAASQLGEPDPRSPLDLGQNQIHRAAGRDASLSGGDRRPGRCGPCR